MGPVDPKKVLKIHFKRFEKCFFQKVLKNAFLWEIQHGRE
jgi:hypothetical protein